MAAYFLGGGGASLVVLLLTVFFAGAALPFVVFAGASFTDTAGFLLNSALGWTVPRDRTLLRQPGACN
jgi:hypothetical protein